MGIKSWVSKRILGFTQEEFANAVADLVNANVYNWIGKDTQISISDNFDYIVNGYMSVPAVYEIISKIVDKIAACPVVIYEVKSGQKLKEYDNLVKSGTVQSLAKAMKIKADAVQEVDVPRIRKLLEEPNEKQTWDDFIRLLSTLLLSTGNSLAYGVSGDARTRKKSEIWALPFNPLQYKIISDGIFDPVKAYRVNYNAGQTRLDFDADDIAHFKTVNPLWATSAGQLYGMAPMHAYKYKLLRSKLGDEAANKLLKNGFRITLVSPRHKEDGWDKNQALSMKDMIRRAASSDTAYDRVLAVSHSVEPTPIGLDSTELGLIDLNKEDRGDIYAGFGAPRIMASTDASTYNNEETSKRTFVYDAVAPRTTLIGDVLTNFICKPFEKADGKKYIIRLDFLSLPELATDMAKATEWLAKAPYLTWNEKREVLGWGRLDIPGMDEPIASRNDVPLSRIVGGENLRTGTGQGENENGGN